MPTLSIELCLIVALLQQTKECEGLFLCILECPREEEPSAVEGDEQQAGVEER